MRAASVRAAFGRWEPLLELPMFCFARACVGGGTRLLLTFSFPGLHPFSGDVSTHMSGAPFLCRSPSATNVCPQECRAIALIYDNLDKVRSGVRPWWSVAAAVVAVVVVICC
jgi:hypothetical protein